MDRRKFLAASTALAPAPLAAPSIASAQTSFNWKMINAYGPGSPFYVEGPGSPTDFCKKVAEMSDGRLKIQHFAAGELIPAMEGFDAVRSGAVEMNAAKYYYTTGWHEPSNVTELLMNKAAWESLPADLQAIVKSAAMAWIAILVAMNLQTSFLTPPFGWALFFLKGVAPPEVKASDIYKGVLPFIGIQLIGLSLVYFFPGLATWLPQAIGW